MPAKYFEIHHGIDGVAVGGDFADTDLESELNLIRLNVISPVHLAKRVVKKNLQDFRCTAVYWYFVVIMWLPFYVIIYVAPYLSRKERF